MNNYFIIETDTYVIDTIKKVLEELPEFNCIGSSSDYDMSMNTILKEMPMLIFINIDCQSNNPFNLVNELNQYLKSDTEFIAISSSKTKTYQAIKTGFFDYLLNPVTDLEIRKTALRFKKKHPSKASKTICLKSYKDFRYLDVEEILFLKADNNTTDFHMSDGSVINSYKTLKTYESILPETFLRVHKSYIINSAYISRINYGKSKFTLKKQKHVPFTKTYIENVDLMVNSLNPISKILLN
ncbi:LytTR family DNA-binding domain-containing protein [Algibacter sp. 2305UL17-15]|uniref:LytR/AlgR family response regulator transcription factor n=1 Tax=Algibacter sp. 2305UL17-15 TaxID=3231268 RepID=UPI00345A8008